MQMEENDALTLFEYVILLNIFEMSWRAFTLTSALSKTDYNTILDYSAPSTTLYLDIPP